MLFSFPTMNPQTQFNHHVTYSFQILNRLGQGYFTRSQTLAPNNHHEIEAVSQQQLDDQNSHEIAAVPQQLDDLSAVVHKCNVKGFENAILSTDTPALKIPAAGARQSRFLSSCEDFTRADSKAHLHSLTKGWRLNGAEEEKQEESVKRNRSVKMDLSPSSSVMDPHIFSERVRRSEMNELITQMRSLLPNPTGKRDKASIVTETIKYIQSLQRELAIHSRKYGTTMLPNQTEATTVPLKSEAKAHQTPSTKCEKSMCSKSWDANLEVNYNGKDIFITINCVNKANLLPSIILAVESHNIEVMDAFVSVTETVTFLCLHVKGTQILDTVAREALSGTLSKLINSKFHVSFKP